MVINSDSQTPHSGLADADDADVQIRDMPAPECDKHGYRIREQPMGTKKRVKVILMGAGASALNFFKKAEEEMDNLDIVCYEKNHDIGGTWLENRYPGLNPPYYIYTYPIA